MLELMGAEATAAIARRSSSPSTRTLTGPSLSLTASAIPPRASLVIVPGGFLTLINRLYCTSGNLLSTLLSLPSMTCTSGILPSSAILSVTLSPTVITKVAFSTPDLKARPFISSSLKSSPIGLASLSLRELGSRYSLRGMGRPLAYLEGVPARLCDPQGLRDLRLRRVKHDYQPRPLVAELGVAAVGADLLVGQRSAPPAGHLLRLTPPPARRPWPQPSPSSAPSLYRLRSIRARPGKAACTSPLSSPSRCRVPG